VAVLRAFLPIASFRTTPPRRISPWSGLCHPCAKLHLSKSGMVVTAGSSRITSQYSNSRTNSHVFLFVASTSNISLLPIRPQLRCQKPFTPQSIDMQVRIHPAALGGNRIPRSANHQLYLEANVLSGVEARRQTQNGSQDNGHPFCALTCYLAICLLACLLALPVHTILGQFHFLFIFLRCESCSLSVILLKDSLSLYLCTSCCLQSG
jgi:hypothetical protein